MIITKDIGGQLQVFSDAETCDEQRRELAADFDKWNLFDEKLTLSIELHEKEGRPYLLLWGKVRKSYEDYKKSVGGLL